MRFMRSLPFFALALMAGVPALAQTPAPAAPPPPQMVLTSSAFPDGGAIPVKYSQAAPGVAPGEGLSPALSWSNVPPGTQSLVLHMHDMEVARNKTTDDQLHWLLWNIPPATTSLPEGVGKGTKLADGTRQISASGPFYRGPGAGANGPQHHYTFEIFALDTTLNVEPTSDPFATRTAIFNAMQGHIIGRAITMGLFKRPN